MPRHLGERAVRFLCRWHTHRSRVPSQRPIGLAIAIIIVGGSLLETGAISPTPIESSVPPAPIAAVTGSGDAPVAMAAPDRGAPFARLGDPAVPTSGSELAVVARAPTGSLALTGMLDAWAATVRSSDAPGPAEQLRALDPDGPADLAVLTTTLAVSAPVPPATGGTARPATTTQAAKQAPAARNQATNQAKKKVRWRRAGPWRTSPRVTWYGPGFYGNRTACGIRYTRYVAGVAHRTLPCGTLVQFRWHGRTAVVPVIDRGPYGGPDLIFDWSAWLACKTFRPKGLRNGCFTRADVGYRVVGKVDLDRWFAHKKG